MKFMKKITGVLLAVSIVFGGLAANTQVVLARDLGDSSQYCEPELVDRFWAIDAENDKINRMFENWVIGVIWEDGSRDESPQTKYYISGDVAEAFWSTSVEYMWGDDEQGITGIVREWDEAGYFGDFDADGSSNWNDDGYLTSISRADMLQVINAMDAVMKPIRQTLNPVPVSNSPDNNKGSVVTHIHNYVETTVQEATNATDAVVTMQCSICGQQQSHFELPGSAVNQFVEDTVKQLEKAPVDGSVTISTDIWTCFNRSVIEALKSRQDVTVTVNFKYKHTDYTFTIPTGYGEDALDALLDENGYCGFMYLLSVFGGGEVS